MATKQPVVPGIETIQFKGIQFLARVTNWSDSRKPSLAVHTMLKRDGARIENMGRDPHVVKMTVYFIGLNWKVDYLALQGTIDEDPSGTLVHPVFGSMRAVCQGIEGATMDIEGAANTYVAPISFIEDNLQDRVDRSRFSAFAKEQEIAGMAELLEADLLGLSQNVQAVGEIYRGVATAFAAAATASAVFSFLSSLFDPSIQNRLGDVRINAVGCRNAIQADTTVDTDAEKYTAIARVEQIYSSCLDLVADFKAQGQTPLLYTVPTTIHIVALATDFYGADGLKRIGEIMENNIGRIPNPSAIARGTRLLMSPRTV